MGEANNILPNNQPAAIEVAAPKTAARNHMTEVLLHGPILPLLIRMASPNVLAFIIQSMVSIAEVWYVGHLGTLSGRFGSCVPIVYADAYVIWWLAGRGSGILRCSIHWRRAY